MITAKIDWTRLPWKEELRNNVTSVEQLRGYIDLSEREAREIADVIRQFPVNIPRYYLSLIDQADPNDPIKKMCFPSMEELVVAGSMGETTRDPYGDDKHDKGNGVLQKYDYSVLIVTTESCAMFCRHCFRRRIVGRKTDHILQNFEAAVEYVARHPEVTNVILSGGDPLMLPTPLLRTLLMALAEIEHLGFVRIGSRTPVTYPCRIFDDELIELFTEFSSKKTLYLPTHFNHVKEITPAAAEAVRRLRMAGVTVNNQAVLLRGVNDRPEDLKALMDGLLRIGVNPYYLYQCMPVSSVSHHFQVPLKQAVEIV
ncbi:MAG TPA: KamA family radical SAM protein, partial [Opitutaceae bacterium]|nr:KamA family radical SAM protein [Opitutaceae bacterium]